MPGFVKTKEDERLWQKAKDLAEEQGHKEDWPYVTGIFKKMKGGKVADRVAGRFLVKDAQSVTASFGEAWDAGHALGVRFPQNPTNVATRAKIVKTLAGDVARMLPKIKEFAEDPTIKLPFFMSHFLQSMRDLERALGVVGGMAGMPKMASGKTATDLEDNWKRGLANGRSQQSPDELGHKQKVALRALDRVESTLRHFRGLVADPLPAKKWPGVKNFFTDFEELIYTLGALAGTAELGKMASHGLPPDDLAPTIAKGKDLGKKLRGGDVAMQQKIGKEDLAALKAGIPVLAAYLDAPTPKIPSKALLGLRAAEDVAFRVGVLSAMGPGKTASDVTVGQYALTKLLATLEALQRFYWTAHWTAKGIPQYGDHLLFQRLYEGLAGEIDDLAEKIVAQQGEPAVDPVVRADLAALRLRTWQDLPGDVVGRALLVEADFQEAVESVLEAGDDEGWMTTGLQNFLEGLADKHETAQYLLGQRDKVAAKVAARWAAANFDLGRIVKELKDLAADADALDALSSSFLKAFGKTAAAGGEIKSLNDAAERARINLHRANAAKELLDEFLKSPNPDPLVVKAAAAADKLVAKLQKVREATRKAVILLAKKELPVALKTLADKTEKLLKARLADPADLIVIPWVSARWGGEVNHHVIFRAKGSKDTDGLEVRQTVPGKEPFILYQALTTLTPQTLADTFVERQKNFGWDKFKYAPGALERRQKAADGIVYALGNVIREAGRKARSDRDEIRLPEISRGGLLISGAYRDWSIPKEGASAVGEYQYDQIVESVLGPFDAEVRKALAPWKDDIKKIGIHTGEKSWIYVNVELK